MSGRDVRGDVEWRVIPGFASYEVSNTGEIRSISRRNRYGSLIKLSDPRVLKQRPNDTGYMRASVVDDDGAKRSLLVHRAVAMAFIGPAPIDRPCVAHLDGCRTNNTYGNLNWVSYRENEAHKMAHGTALLGSRANAAKLTERTVLEMRSAHRRGASIADLSRLHHITVPTAWAAVRGKNWKHVRSLIKEDGANG